MDTMLTFIFVLQPGTKLLFSCPPPPLWKWNTVSSPRHLQVWHIDSSTTPPWRWTLFPYTFPHGGEAQFPHPLTMAVKHVLLASSPMGVKYNFLTPFQWVWNTISSLPRHECETQFPHPLTMGVKHILLTPSPMGLKHNFLTPSPVCESLILPSMWEKISSPLSCMCETQSPHPSPACVKQSPHPSHTYMKYNLLTLAVPSPPIGLGGLPVSFSLLFTPSWLYALISSEGGQIWMGSIWWGVCVCMPYVANICWRRTLSEINTNWITKSVGELWKHESNTLGFVQFIWTLPH